LILGNVPAVDDNWASLGLVALLHPLQEHKEWGGRVGNTMIGPSSELELTDFTALHAASLDATNRS